MAAATTKKQQAEDKLMLIQLFCGLFDKEIPYKDEDFVPNHEGDWFKGENGWGRRIKRYVRVVGVDYFDLVNTHRQRVLHEAHDVLEELNGLM
jgi:hypothetical protein